MDGFSLRIPEDLLEDLEEESVEWGYEKLSPYIRHILRERHDGVGDASLAERVEKLEARVDELESDQSE